MSISVFSIASFISMVALLALIQSNRAGKPPHVPLAAFVRRVWLELAEVALKIMEYGNATKDYYGIPVCFDRECWVDDKAAVAAGGAA